MDAFGKMHLEDRSSKLNEKGWNVMSQIIVDAAMRMKLTNLSRSVDLCDESGIVIARLVPVLDQSQFEPVEPIISAEELQRRRQEPDFSTAEVIAFLEKL
jgi:hypothetical protein